MTVPIFANTKTNPEVRRSWPRQPTSQFQLRMQRSQFCITFIKIHHRDTILHNNNETCPRAVRYFQAELIIDLTVPGKIPELHSPTHFI